MIDLFVNILTPDPLTSQDTGRKFLELLCRVAPDLAPQRCGNYEPIKVPFDPANLDEALATWRWPFLWKRTRPRAQGGVWMGPADGSLHGWITIDAESVRIDRGSAVRFLKEAAVCLSAEFAFVHVLAPQEIEKGVAAEAVGFLDRAHTKPRLSVTTHELRKFLPDLYWGTVFGGGYVPFFGRQRLLDAPAPVVQELGDNLIYLQLSEDPLDFKERFDEVECVRRAVKEHLGPNAFFDPRLGHDHAYDLPELTVGTKDPHAPRPDVFVFMKPDGTVDVQGHLKEIDKCNGQDPS